MQSKGIKTELLSGTKKDFFSIAKTIRKYLKEESISVIHSHLSNADLIAVLVKKIYNKKVFLISTKHGYDEKYLIKYGNGYNKIDYNLYYFISRFINYQINENIATSKFIADMYNQLKLGNKKMNFIHHGIKNSYKKVEEKQTSEANIIVVGRLVEVKGQKYLIEALPFIIKKFPELKLFILGEGNYKTRLEDLAAKLGVLSHVKFEGFQKPEDYISRCQVIIVPSLFEAFGMVFIEAFSLNIPVVAFNVGAGNEIIKDNVTGLLVPPFSIQTLSEKIIYLLEHPEERKRITENAYREFANEYTTDKMVEKTVNWYNSVI
jgi:glycosyltransferase involved in cell wall biosynthesis